MRAHDVMERVQIKLCSSQSAYSRTHTRTESAAAVRRESLRDLWKDSFSRANVDRLAG